MSTITIKHVITRHGLAEKTGSNPNDWPLSSQGESYANNVLEPWVKNNVGTTNPVVVNSDEILRCQQTAEPTAQEYGVQVNSFSSQNIYNQIATWLDGSSRAVTNNQFLWSLRQGDIVTVYNTYIQPLIPDAPKNPETNFFYEFFFAVTQTWNASGNTMTLTNQTAQMMQTYQHLYNPYGTVVSEPQPQSGQNNRSSVNFNFLSVPSSGTLQPYFYQNNVLVDTINAVLMQDRTFRVDKVITALSPGKTFDASEVNVDDNYYVATPHGATENFVVVIGQYTN